MAANCKIIVYSSAKNNNNNCLLFNAEDRETILKENATCKMRYLVLCECICFDWLIDLLILLAFFLLSFHGSSWPLSRLTHLGILSLWPASVAERLILVQVYYMLCESLFLSCVESFYCTRQSSQNTIH